MEATEMEMLFKINDEMVTLFLPVDGSDHIFQVTNDDEYAVKYLLQLINNGFISLKEPMESVCRIDDTGQEVPIYPPKEAQLKVIDEDTEEAADTSTGETRTDTECLIPAKSVSDSESSSNELWSYEAVLALLASMSTHLEDLNHPRKKKIVFSNISNDLLSKKFSYTEKACYNKWRSLLRSYKSTKDKMKSTGQGATRFLFFNQIDELIGDKPSNSSGNTLESNNNIPNTSPSTAADIETETETEYNTSNSQNNPKKRKRRNKQDIREEAKQKRHDERMRMEERKLEVEERKCALIEKFIEKI